MAPSSTRKSGRKVDKRDGRTWWSSMWSDSLEFGARRMCCSGTTNSLLLCVRWPLGRGALLGCAPAKGGLCTACARVEPKAKPFFAPVTRVAPPTKDKHQVARSMMQG
jgi:hypothetical protein